MIPSFARWQDMESVRQWSIHTDNAIGLHLYAMAYSRAKEIGQPIIVEIGFFRGYTAAMFLFGCYDANSAGHVFSVDIDTCVDGLKIIESLPFNLKRFHQFIHGNSAEIGVIEQVRAIAKNYGGLDLLYLDGGSDQYRVSDLAVYGELMREGGKIICNDVQMFGRSTKLAAICKTGGGLTVLQSSPMPGTSAADRVLIRQCITEVLNAFPGQPLRIAEVGLSHGGTACTILDHLDGPNEATFDVDYRGVDAFDRRHKSVMNNPRIKFMQGPSSLPRCRAFLGDSLHAVFIDGCHCEECVTVDAVLYGQSLLVGGVMMIHDASPMTADEIADETSNLTSWIHSDRSAAARQPVRDTLAKIDFDSLGLQLAIDAVDQVHPGVQAYRKIR